MTTSTAEEVSSRRPGRPRRSRSFAEHLFTLSNEVLSELEGAAVAFGWPSDRYRERPVEFLREIVGVEPWSKQVEVIEAVRDHKRVAVSSGHKVSKSHSAAAIALWFYSSFTDARVVMTSTTSRQVDQILWRELKIMHARSGRCVECKVEEKRRAERREVAGPRPCPHSALLDGTPRELARTGIKSADFREIVGFTARESEAVAGISGKNLLYICDEASGIAQEIFDAIEGNRAGGARIVLFSNPTRTEGEFFEAFHAKAALYKTIRISSEDSPNVIEGRDVIPGLATREWVEEKRQEWGEESPLYKIRVKGEFVLNESGKILSVHTIGEAEKRWAETAAEGRLQIGLDPAGEGEAADESVFAVRRGQKVTRLVAHRAQSAEALLTHALGLIKEDRKPHELALLVLDAEGQIGARVYGTFRAYADRHPDAFELVGVRSSRKAVRERETYELVRDELWASLSRWIREGGAIPEDAKLAKDLHAQWWTENVRRQSRIQPKEEIKKILGRSPDRGDAVCLAVWQVESERDDDGGAGGKSSSEDDLSAGSGGNLSPYGGSIDPYGDGGL